MVNAVNGLLPSSILTCQYPNFRSSEENQCNPCKLSSVSSMWGSEYASLMVCCSASWGQYRTSDCCPFSRPGPLCLPMDCVTSGWHQYPSFPGYGPSHCHTCEEVYIGNTSWRVFNLSPLFYAWSEQFYPGPGHCGQTGVPIWAAALWLVPALVWATPWDLGGQGPLRPIPFWVWYWVPWKSLLGGPPVVPG